MKNSCMLRISRALKYANSIFATPKMHWRVILCTIFLCISIQAVAQEKRILVQVQNQPISEALKQIEKQVDYTFFYNNKVIKLDKKSTINISSSNLNQVLDSIFEDTDIEYSIVDNNIVLSLKSVKSIPEKFDKLTGKVVDDSELPIIGASISLEGTAIGTVTDIDGRFSLQWSEQLAKGKLSVSYIGYDSKTVSVNNRNSITIVLSENTVQLDAVVVTALGIKKEAKSLSYNVQQVGLDEIAGAGDANFINSLTGKIAGATINSSSSGIGGSSRVVLRGSKSISGNNNALYVIDGIPMPSLSSAQPSDIYSGAGQTGDGVSNINPDDIETISVLSGPSAAALYGSAAANGVIMITTKKGVEEKLSVNYSNTTTFMNPLVLPKFQNRYGASETGSYYSWGDKLNTKSDYSPKDFFQTGFNTSNSVSLSTGSNKNQTYLSIGNVTAEGIIHNNNYDRYSMTVRNTSNMLNDKLHLDLSFMYSKVKEKNMTAQGLYMNPLVPVYLFPAGDDFSKVQSFERYDTSRNFPVQYWPYGDQGLSMQNPYWITERTRFVNNKSRYMFNASLKYDLTDWVNLSARVKIDNNTNKYEKKFNASTNTLFASEAGYYSLEQQDTRQLYGDFMANINKYFYDNQINITANIGANIEDVKYDQHMYGGKLHGVPNLFTFSNVNTSTAESSQSGYHTQKQSLYASAQIGYRSFLYLDLTARNDWPSTLAGSNTKSLFYPTAGLSGIITDMFNIQSSILSYLKVRVSYSEVGNEPDPFLTIPTYSLASGMPIVYTRMPNPNLKPERTNSWEGGTNIYLFNNKLKIDATAYYSKTKNQFFEPTLSTTSGYSSVIVNAGRVDNKGIELSANYTQNISNINWNTYFTYSLNRNKVVTLLDNWINPITNESISLNEIDMGGTSMYKMVLTEGGSMGDIYVNTLRVDEHGAIYVHPTDQTVMADPNNFIYAGNSNPKYNLSWGNNLSWNGLSLGFLFTARVGGVGVSNTQAILNAFGASKESADARDAGGVLVNGSRIPAQNYYQTVQNIGSPYVYSATNIRLAELTFGYSFPKINKWTNDALKGLNVSLIGKNLFFLYKKAPYDPEMTANTSTYYQGIDYFMTPSLRSLGFSVKINL